MRGRGQAGIALGDALVILSLFSLVFAVVLPRVKKVAFDRRLDDVISAVDALRMAAERTRLETGTWPADAPAEMVPAELAGGLPPDFSFTREWFSLDWDVWDVVLTAEPLPEVEAREIEPVRGRTNLALAVPPPSPTSAETVGALAGITVRTADESILAALLARFGRRRSFVRDGTWTLIIVPREEA